MSRAREFADLAGSADAGGIAGKNILDNAGFLVAQKGTSFSITNPNAPLRALDRWTYRRSGTFANVRFTVSQSTGPSAGNSPHAMKIQTTTVEGNNPNDNESAGLSQGVERQDIEHIGFGTNTCKPCTMSFYVKSSITGTFYAALYSGAHAQVVHQPYIINSANTWEYKTVTFPALTSGTDNGLADNSIGLAVYWVLDAVNHSSGVAGTWRDTTGGNNNPLFTPSGAGNTGFVNTLNATFEISGCKLEVGEKATPLQLRSFGDELARCKRYYEEHNFDTTTSMYGGAQSGSRAECPFVYDVTKRANPTISVNDRQAFRVNDWRGGDQQCSAFTVLETRPRQARLGFDKSTSNLDTGRVVYINREGAFGTDPILFIDAEL